MESSQPLVTITGVTGYIGSLVCLYFLKDGGFKVRGTVRSVNAADKIDPLKAAYGELFEQLELVEADLLDKESMMKAIEGSTYVVHTASPFPMMPPKNPDTLLKPAIEGTLAVMNGCLKAKVKRCVVTSSCASIMFSPDTKKTNFTPEDWSDPNMKAIDPYCKSKTLAEKAAWDFVANLPEEDKFELAVINPSFVLGPNINTCKFTSGDIVKSIMLKKFPALPQMCMGCVDVRDVAQGHLQAIKVPEAAGHRFILCEKGYLFTEIGETCNTQFKDQGYTPVHKSLPKFVMWFMGCFDAGADHMYKKWGVKDTYDNSKTTQILGINFIPLEKSLEDMVPTLIQTGYLEDKTKKK